MHNKRIFLIGFMGSGKTSFGKKLARQLDYRHLDLDRLLENKLQQSVSEIFSSHGEAFFRKQEQETLAGLFSEEQLVISVGGGTPCFFNNMQQMLEHGTCIYLKMNPKALQSRLRHAKAKRPLIAELTDDELLDFIDQKLSEREHFYLQAHHVIEGLNIKPEEVVRMLEMGG